MTDLPLHILVADDEATARLLLKSALETAGFQVSVAADGEDALRRFQAEACDMVMLDVDMPGLSGYQVCARLREKAGNDLPIVMVTGMDDLASVELAFKTGATDFISKPINWALLGHRVRYLFRGHRLLQELHISNQRNRAILNAIPDSMLRLDGAGRVLDVRFSGTMRDGRPPPLPGEALSEYFPATVASRMRAAMALANTSGTTATLSFSLARDDREPNHYEARLAGVGGDETLCLVRDITERKRHEQEILAAHNRLRDTLNAIPDLLFEMDLDGRYLAYHAQNADLLAAPPDLFLGRTLTEVLPAEAAAISMSALREAHQQGTSFGRQIFLPLRQGGRWFDLSVSRKSNNADERPHFIMLSHDITRRKEAEHSVYRLAYFDTLTGLPNRQSFIERLEREIQRARRNGDKLAVMFLDLDGFKNVNDTLGHAAGDLLLQAVAERLQQCIRPEDLVARSDPQETEVDIARLGGDEFTVLIPQLRQTAHAIMVANRIHELTRRPFNLEGQEVALTTSIGIALFPDDGEDAAALLKHADTAMYHAKDEGRDNYRFYSAPLTQMVMRRLNLASNLRLALDRNEFFLVYQPQLDLASGRINSVEALIRWQHPEEGLVSPAEFIPAAEENGLIIPIGQWVLRTACAQAARWYTAGSPLRMAVNLSAVQLRHPGLVPGIRAILTETGLAAEWLELEVTEGALMDDTEATMSTLAALRGLGVQLSLDDFGTGYSSLSYLKRMPLHNLKVDQSFVRGLPEDQDSLAIVRAIISLAKNLGFTVTAEGIETMEQARIMRQLECETLQGYYIGKPAPAHAIAASLSPLGLLEKEEKA